MENYQKVASLIQNASFVLVLAGAGMSAESGLKTYEEINSKPSTSFFLSVLEESLGNGKEYADYCDPDMVLSFTNNCLLL